jgi:hypothetical protein
MQTEMFDVVTGVGNHDEAVRRSDFAQTRNTLSAADTAGKREH